jgi:hypothetical protein
MRKRFEIRWARVPETLGMAASLIALGMVLAGGLGGPL